MRSSVTFLRAVFALTIGWSCALFAADVAHAATFVVTTLEDTADGLCNAHCSLREAVQAANDSRAGAPHRIELGIVGNHRLDGDSVGNPGAGGLLFLHTTLEVINTSGGTVAIDGARRFLIFVVQPEGGLPAALTLRGVVITGAGSAGGNAGAVTNFGGTLLIEDSTLIDNNAIAGAVNNRGVADLRRVLISNNKSELDDGGGIVNSGLLRISNSTISNNVGRVTGGIRNYGQVEIDFTTIADNSGIGVKNDEPASLAARNSIIANQSRGPNCYGTTGSFSGSNNLQDSTSPTCGSAFTSTGVLRLGPLAANGGPRLSHALGVGSVAINAATGGDCPAVDGRGFARPAGSACDVGSHEVPSTPPQADLVVTGSPSPSFFWFGHTVAFEVIVRNAGPFRTVARIESFISEPVLGHADWACTPQSGGATCASDHGSGNVHTTADLAPGAHVVLLVTARAADVAPTATGVTEPHVAWLRVFAMTPENVGEVSPADNAITLSKVMARSHRSTTGTEPSALPESRGPGIASPSSGPRKIVTPTRRG
jgi:CSLREA domain-containing protein